MGGSGARDGIRWRGRLLAEDGETADAVTEGGAHEDVRRKVGGLSEARESHQEIGRAHV